MRYREAKGRQGWTVEDRWKTERAKIGKRWKARARDRALRKYISKAFEHYDDAVDWAKEQAERINKGQRTRGNISFDEAVKEFLKHIDDTDAAHIRHNKMVLERASSEAGFTDLSHVDMMTTRGQDWINGLVKVSQSTGKQTDEQASPRTKNHYLTTLRALGNYLVKRDWLEKNPWAAVKPIKEHRKTRDVYRLSELREMVSDKHRDNKYWLVGVLAIYTAMRVRELRACKWSWFDWEAGLIRIPAEDTKAAKDREIFIQPELLKILEPIRKVGNVLVLDMFSKTKHVSDQTGKAFKLYLAEIGIDRTGRILHDLRHSAASLMHATGLSSEMVGEFIGDDDKATRDHYQKGAKSYLRTVQKEGWSKGEFRLDYKTSMSRSHLTRETSFIS